MFSYADFRKRNLIRSVLLCTIALCAVMTARQGQAHGPSHPNRPAMTAPPPSAAVSPSERRTLEQLIDAAGLWADTCKGRSATNVKGADASLNLEQWWAGRRFSDMVRQTHGDKQIEEASRMQIRRAPNDFAAYLRLAYALRADGDVAGMRRELGHVPALVYPAIKQPKPNLHSTPSEHLTFPNPAPRDRKK